MQAGGGGLRKERKWVLPRLTLALPGHERQQEGSRGVPKVAEATASYVLPYQHLNSESSLLERKTAISSQKGSLCTFHSSVISRAKPRQQLNDPISTFPKYHITEPGTGATATLVQAPHPPTPPCDWQLLPSSLVKTDSGNLDAPDDALQGSTME